MFKSFEIPMAALLSFCVLAAPAGAQQLVKERALSQVAGIQIYTSTEKGSSQIFVKPKVGLKSMLAEISNKLEHARKSALLNHADLDLFSAKAVFISDELDELRLASQQFEFDEKQACFHSIAKQMYKLGQEINASLQTTMMAGLCPDGNCVARTQESLYNQAKQVKEHLKVVVSAGKLDSSTAKSYYNQIDRLYRLAVGSPNAEGNIQLGSRNLLNLDNRIRVEFMHKVQNDRT